MDRAPSSSSSHTRPAFHPTFVNISFVGANALARELGTAGEGVIVSQVVPFPWDVSLKVVADYQAAQRALDPGLTPDSSRWKDISRASRAAALERARTGPDTRWACCRSSTKSANSTSAAASSPSARKCGTRPPNVFLTVIQKDGAFRAIDRL